MGQIYQLRGLEHVVVVVVVVTAAVVTREYDDSIDGRETLRLIYSQLRRAKEILGDSRNPLGILIE